MWTLQGGTTLALVRVVMAGATPLHSRMASWVGGSDLSLLLASLVNGRALGNTVVVALPDDVGVGGKCEHALDGLPVGHDSLIWKPAVDEEGFYAGTART